MTSRHTDLLVLGGGTMGTAAGWAAANRGLSVRVLEQFGHIHDFGSHSGITRIFRHAYAEGVDYVPWMLEADDDWQGLEDRAGETFIHRIGVLDMAAPGSSQARDARASADAWNLDYEWLTGAQVRDRFPAMNIPDDWETCYTTRSGAIELQPALRAMGRELVEAGGHLETNCQVTAWNASDEGVSVESDGGTFSADALIITAGAWNSRMLNGLDLPLEVWRIPVLWFTSSQPETITPDACPCWMAEFDGTITYGIPQIGATGMKAGVHSQGIRSDPDTVDREVHQSDIDEVIGPFMRTYLNGFTGDVDSSTVCMYTMTPDEHFLIDRHPEHANVAFAAGFSGHGFKFAPVVGKHLVDLAVNPSVAPKPLFSLNRFAGSTAQS